jgi:hypothetical protein
MNTRLKDNYNKIANSYAEEFAKKNNEPFEGWVNNIVGAYALVGDVIYTYDDIRYDIDNDIPAGKLYEYVEYFVRTEYPGVLTYNEWLQA